MPRRPDKIKNEFYSLELKQGIIYLQFTENIVINREIAAKMVEARKRMIGKQNCPVLLFVHGKSYVTASGRKYLASAEAEEGISAVGCVIKRGYSKTLLEFYLLFNKPKLTYKIFTDTDDAIAWLESIKK